MNPSPLIGKNFLSLHDFSAAEIDFLLALSAALKKKKIAQEKGNLLAGKSIALLFEKDSTRTRSAFEVAVFDEGGQACYLSDSHFGTKESVEDTAKVLGRFYHGIAFRGFKQATVEILGKYAGVPVWNALTDEFHPTQVLADFLTIQEHVCKPLAAVKLVYVGDIRNNVGKSLMVGAAKMGMHFVGLGPRELQVNQHFIQKIKELSTLNNAKIELLTEIGPAVLNADVIYTDIWASMGEEDELAHRIKILLPYQVTQKMMALTANKNTLFMHCLPAFHDIHTSFGKKIFDKYGLKFMEVSDEVFRNSVSRVFDQAENRLHTIKAIMVATMSTKEIILS